MTAGKLLLIALAWSALVRLSSRGKKLLADWSMASKEARIVSMRLPATGTARVPVTKPALKSMLRFPGR